MSNETPKHEVTFVLPEDVIKQLSGLAVVDGIAPVQEISPGGVADEGISQEVAAAVNEYIANRKADPSFPILLAAARDRQNRLMDAEILGIDQNPHLN